MKITVTGARVTIAGTIVLVVEVAPWIIGEPRHAEAVLAAYVGASGTAVVLLAREPCGCRRMCGARAHIDFLDAGGLAGLVWRAFTLDVSWATPRRRRARAIDPRLN